MKTFSPLSLDVLFSPGKRVGRIRGEERTEIQALFLRGPESEKVSVWEVSMGGEYERRV